MSGLDITDYFLRGGTAEALLADMDRLRSAGDDEGDGDGIALAMEAAFLELTAPRQDYSAALVSEDDILSRPPLRYIVEPFVPRAMLTAMFGQPGSGKTFVGQDMQNSVRAGIDWHSHPTSPGAVLLLEAEGLQQLQARILAWNELHEDPPLAAFRALDEPLDLSSPAGAAALVRTVRGMERATGEKVELVWVDPAALYMASGENEDGNRNLALGLNAVAKYLDIGVLLIVHTNASGERARGTDHLRMLSGSYVRVEKLDNGLVGVVQEKVKNTAPRAVILRPVEAGPSIAFATEQTLSAAEYAAQRDRSQWTTKTTHRLAEARAVRATKHDEAADLIRAALAGQPPLSTSQIVRAMYGKGVGTDSIKTVLAQLVEDGVLVTTAGARNSVLHSLAEVGK